MSSKKHIHWDRYHVRIVPESFVMTSGGGVKNKPEKLQLICIDCGMIFHEKEIETKN